jgi:hypothetical protein
LSPSADGSTGEVREPAVVAEAPAGGDVLATIQAASVCERMVEPPWDPAPGKRREPAAVAERLATGRAAAGPPPAGIGESASRSPVDEAGDTPSVNGDGQPVMDFVPDARRGINRGRDLIQSADVSTGEVPEPAAVPEESAGGDVLATIQAASVGERMVEPPWYASPGKLREPAAVAERLATGRAGGWPAASRHRRVGQGRAAGGGAGRQVREPAVVAERLATGRAAAGPPPAVVAERLATGRTAAGPPPADVGESASRSPVDEPADARPADSDGSVGGRHAGDARREDQPGRDVNPTWKEMRL